MTFKAQFDEAARDAMRRGREEIETTGRMLAAQFEANPAHFDPKRLQSLGRTGLAVFFSAIAERSGPSEVKDDDTHAVMSDRQPQDWIAERRSECGFVARAIISGVGGGLILIAIAPLVRLFPPCN